VATFRKRSGSWQVQVRLKNAEPQSRSFSTRAEAVAWARDIEARAVRLEALPDFRLLRTTTFGALMKRYLETVTPKKRGAYQEGHRLRKLMQHPISATSMSKLNAAALAAYRDERLMLVQGPTVRRELVILRHILETARNEWSLPLSSNPVSNIAIPAPSKARQRRVERYELHTVLEACDNSRSSFLGPIVRLALETAMRRGELLAMQWRDVDWKKQTLRIPITKTEVARVIPLSPGAMAILKRLRTHQSIGKVFSASPNAVRLAWERAMRRVGISDLHFHDLRHEAISRCFELGLSVPEVALISGHKDPRTLFGYTHLRAEDIGEKLKTRWTQQGGKMCDPSTSLAPTLSVEGCKE